MNFVQKVLSFTQKEEHNRIFFVVTIIYNHRTRKNSDFSNC